jgi:branched-chain amino acid transport system ATP-binding protein
MNKMLEVKNLMVFYENALAINGVSLEIEKGEIIGVFGSNGAGKSTLMDTISGLILDLKTKEARRGGERITILGEIEYELESIIHTKPRYRVEKGIVLAKERHPVFPDSDVMENLKIAGYLRKWSEVKQSFHIIFGFFPHLKSLRGKRAGLLSGGEQQMLMIAMALMARPKLMLLDEPLLGLSPLLQSDLVRTIIKIRNEGITVLVTEQYARPLLPIIDRGYVMGNGILILKGTRQELIDNPEVRAAYFGTMEK